MSVASNFINITLHPTSSASLSLADKRRETCAIDVAYNFITNNQSILARNTLPAIKNNIIESVNAYLVTQQPLDDTYHMGGMRD